MRPIPTTIGLVFGLLISAVTYGQTVEREVGPLPRFFPHRATYLELEAERRSHFELAYTVSSQAGIAADEIEMWYEIGDQRVSFDIDQAGRIGHMPDLPTLEAEPVVWINQEGGGMSLSMQFEANLPGGPDYAANDLSLALGQANHAIRRAAGVAALFAPDFKTLTFLFDGPAPTAQAILDDGSTVPLTVQENRVVVRPRDRAMRRLVRIELGAAPVRVLLDT